MEKKIKKIIDGLIAEINNHNHDYYVLDDPKLSDKEYDNLFRKLEKLENEHPSLITQLSPNHLDALLPSLLCETIHLSSLYL